MEKPAMDAGATDPPNGRGERGFSSRTSATLPRRTSQRIKREDANLLAEEIDDEAGLKSPGLGGITADDEDPNGSISESAGPTGGEQEGGYLGQEDESDLEPGPEEGIYKRRHEIESDGSVFEPSDEEEDINEQRDILPDEDENNEHGDFLHDEEEAAPSDDQRTGHEVTDDAENTLAPWSPRKRSFGLAFPEDGSFKRVRGTFHAEYLSLLNEDIQDAVAKYLPTAETELGDSQIGLTMWTSAEKDLFFEAVSRLGVDDAPAIAARIGTKGGFEVAQYLALLHDCRAARMKANELDAVHLSDHAAAVEVSQACCKVLDEAADAISLRQETHEESREEERWGDDWLITWSSCRGIEEAEKVKSAGFFKTQNLLVLSQRIFMNAAFPEGNWQMVAEESPSIRATALEDFYALVVSITKRLMAAAIYTADSRIRSQQTVRPGRKRGDIVRALDVELAAMSVGLKVDSQEFWAKCPRRLKLDVLDDEDEDAQEYLEPMAYEEVEKRLGVKAARLSFTAEASSDESSSSEEDDVSSPVQENPGSADEADDIRRESLELLRHTLLEYPPTTRVRQGLEARIAAARAHEAYAEALDARAAYREEKRLWAMLGRDPPAGLTKVDMPRAPKAVQFHGDGLMALHGGSWRDRVQYVNEWDVEMENRDSMEYAN